MNSATTPATKPKKPDVYRIVKYPDRSSPSGSVFFVDKEIKKRFLWVFPYTDWQVVRFTNGESIHWYDLDKCTKDVQRLKDGLKIYR